MTEKEFNLSDKKKIIEETGTDLCKTLKKIRLESSGVHIMLLPVFMRCLSKIREREKEFIKIIEEIVTRRCMGTSANCYEIKKEIKARAGDALVK